MTYQKVTLAPFPKGEVMEKILKKRETKKIPNSGRFDIRKKEAIAKASNNGECWWVAQYLNGVL